MVLTFFTRMLIASLAIAAIQYLLSLLFRNFVLPVGLAAFGIAFSLIAGRWRYIDWIPYRAIADALNGFSAESVRCFTSVELINIGYFMAFTVLAGIVFRRLKA